MSHRSLISVIGLLLLAAACGGPEVPPPRPRGEVQKFRCAELPVAGYLVREHKFHDCLTVELGRHEYQFFMGGSDPSDRSVGVLYVSIPRVDEGVYRVPGRVGDVTITSASLATVCFKTANGDIGAFDVKTLTFLEAGHLLGLCGSM